MIYMAKMNIYHLKIQMYCDLCGQKWIYTVIFFQEKKCDLSYKKEAYFMPDTFLTSISIQYSWWIKYFTSDNETQVR